MKKGQHLCGVRRARGVEAGVGTLGASSLPHPPGLGPLTAMPPGEQGALGYQAGLAIFHMSLHMIGKGAKRVRVGRVHLV